MISCIIIEDERRAREAFEKMVNLYFKDELKVLELCVSVEAGVKAIHKHNPEIVFLDIEMPEENGFKLFEYFKTIDFEVIFTTAYNQYAIKAIKFSALDYLLKPIDLIDLRTAIKQYKDKDKKKMLNETMEVLLSNMNMGDLINCKVALPTLSGYQMEKINNIIYCEADANYTRIFLASSKSHLVSKTLKVVEDLLPDEVFFRIHKSYLINLNYVDEYSRVDGHKVILERGVELSIAHRRIDDFVKAITNNSFNKK